jgi:sulfur relay (sulfurtransferase) DsrC/TusE family protein
MSLTKCSWVRENDQAVKKLNSQHSKEYSPVRKFFRSSEKVPSVQMYFLAGSEKIMGMEKNSFVYLENVQRFKKIMFLNKNKTKA